MSDLRLEKTTTQDFDLVFENGDLALSDSLAMSIVLSIECWCRSDEPDGSAVIDPSIGGWWADALNERPIGSKLWTLFRRKLDDVTISDAEKLVSDSLQWLIDDGVAKSVNVDAKIGNDRNTAVFAVSVERPDGEKDEFKFYSNWEAS